ncbi:hypothetical protein BaRGS_00007378 [Batillaria attramentaria]|uniref:Uncharacterized protein n=1 Tax=Batillaria attramentaria TaxID=370345 RepID=A0ABD0LPU4_9CAEN
MVAGYFPSAINSHRQRRTARRTTCAANQVETRLGEEISRSSRIVGTSNHGPGTIKCPGVGFKRIFDVRCHGICVGPQSSDMDTSDSTHGKDKSLIDSSGSDSDSVFPMLQACHIKERKKNARSVTGDEKSREGITLENEQNCEAGEGEISERGMTAENEQNCEAGEGEISERGMTAENEQNCETGEGEISERGMAAENEQNCEAGEGEISERGMAAENEQNCEGELPWEGVYLQSRGTGKYKWDKKHSCKYCKKLVLKMSTHMMTVHDKEPEVAKILAMDKGCKQRRQAWIALQDEGDYLYNVSVLEKRSGTIIPKYRTKTGKVEDMIACCFCRGLYQRKLVSVHTKHCHKKPSTAGPHRKGEAAKMGRLMLPVPLDVESSFFHKVIAKLRDDEISRIIKSDSLLLKYGTRLFDRRDIEEHSANQINARMRELGRLVQILREKSEMKVSTLNAVISAFHFDLLVSAVKDVAEFDANKHEFRKGYLAMRLGHSLKKCSRIKRSEATKQLGQGSDDEWQNQIKEADQFDSVFSGDWYDCISATAAQSVGRQTMNKPKLIPSCEDVVKVQNLLDQKMASSDYPTVVKATLCAVSLFNRKRGGELQRMKTTDLQSTFGPTTNTNHDLLKV